MYYRDNVNNGRPRWPLRHHMRVPMGSNDGNVQRQRAPSFTLLWTLEVRSSRDPRLAPDISSSTRIRPSTAWLDAYPHPVTPRVCCHKATCAWTALWFWCIMMVAPSSWSLRPRKSFIPDRNVSTYLAHHIIYHVLPAPANTSTRHGAWDQIASILCQWKGLLGASSGHCMIK